MDFLAKNLLKWYKINKRDLPWRQVSDPYKVWISEIILQQTQVIQGLAYYNRFVNQYPTLNHLAGAPFDELMRLWQGLGYYSRARNLHEAAKTIVKEYKGVFPGQYLQIRELKGVGEYTAAAIASFAFNLPYAVVDGNVYRFLSRFFGIKIPIDTTLGKKYFQQLANDLLPEKNAGEYNQAIMEFGALHCRPATPDCENCIFNGKCLAYKNKQTHLLPIKSKKLKSRNRYLNYVVFTNKKNTYLNKREGKDIWKGLYEFFLMESPEPESADKVLQRKELREILKGTTFAVKTVSKEYKHLLSHQTLLTRFYHIELKKPLPLKSLIKVKIETLPSYAFPRLIDKYLKEENIVK